VFARPSRAVRRAMTIRLLVKPNARGRLLVRHSRYRVTLSLWVSFTPTWGLPRSLGFYGIRLSRGRR
jgi:hypothetical protein